MTKAERKAAYLKKKEEEQWEFTWEIIQYHMDRMRMPEQQFIEKYGHKPDRKKFL